MLRTTAPAQHTLGTSSNQHLRPGYPTASSLPCFLPLPLPWWDLEEAGKIWNSVSCRPCSIALVGHICLVEEQILLARIKGPSELQGQVHTHTHTGACMHSPRD